MSKGQPVRVKSSLGQDLLFKSMELSEELGRLFHCQLELLSPKENIELDDVLAHDMTVEIDLPNGGKRHVHGFVTDAAQTGRVGRYATYSVTLRPWLWFLTRTADCRIFQNLKAPEIIKKVFRDNGFSDFKESLNASYRQWEYCVQYRETDFNFVSRLMEQEGIYYFFEEAPDGKHTCVLADSPGAHSPIKGYEKIPYFPPSDNVQRDEHVSDWTLTKSVRTGKYGLGAYHFRKPKTKLEVYDSITYPYPRADAEFFDYPGEHYEVAEGNRYVKLRMEEIAAQHETVAGETDAMGLYPGGLFKLEKHPRADQNREYLIVSARHRLTIGGYETQAAQEETDFSCRFEAVPSDVHFRTPRTTPKPAMQGPQTAIVVGASGEEIDTDEYGRVKVQFRWDRLGKNNENSSCWVRVAQVWAGSAWGGITTPRIGQEVVVDFIEGDPDRPIVTGRLYNADDMPPYPLPDNKTRSTIKSRSTKSGTPDNFNEIRFEDKKDSEEIYIHAEKDQNVVVENNQTIKVGLDKKDAGDRTLKVHNDEVIEIGRDRSLQVDRDKSEHVKRNKTIKIDGRHAEQVAGNMSISIASSLTESVAINYAETVGAAMELAVGGALSVTVGGAMTEAVGGRKSATVGGGMSLSVGGDLTETIGGNRSITIKKDLKEAIDGQQRAEVKKEFVLEAQKIQLVAKEEINIKTGDATIVMKSNGDITINGKAINVKGSGDIVLKGSTIKEN